MAGPGVIIPSSFHRKVLGDNFEQWPVAGPGVIIPSSFHRKVLGDNFEQWPVAGPGVIILSNSRRELPADNQFLSKCNQFIGTSFDFVKDAVYFGITPSSKAFAWANNASCRKCVR